MSGYGQQRNCAVGIETELAVRGFPLNRFLMKRESGDVQSKFPFASVEELVRTRDGSRGKRFQQFRGKGETRRIFRRERMETAVRPGFNASGFVFCKRKRLVRQRAQKADFLHFGCGLECVIENSGACCLNLNESVFRFFNFPDKTADF